MIIDNINFSCNKHNRKQSHKTHKCQNKTFSIVNKGNPKTIISINKTLKCIPHQTQQIQRKPSNTNVKLKHKITTKN